MTNHSTATMRMYFVFTALGPGLKVWEKMCRGLLVLRLMYISWVCGISELVENVHFLKLLGSLADRLEPFLIDT